MKIWQNIPESLTARLLNVVVLDVHSNQLKSLPNSIGCLTKLKVLNAAGNLLRFLPKTIENCRFVIKAKRFFLLLQNVFSLKQKLHYKKRMYN